MFARRERMNRRGVGVVRALDGDAIPIIPEAQTFGVSIHADTISSATALDPLTYALADVGTGLSAVRCYVNGDLGVSEAGGAGTGVDTWTDQHSSANHIVQATLGSRPLFRPRDSSVGGHGTVRGNGASRFAVVGSYNPPAPGTTPVFIWAVAKARTWASGGVLWGGTSSNMRFQQTGTTPNVALRNSTAGTQVAMTLNQWYEISGFYSTGATAVLRVGSTTTDPHDIGADNGGALGLFDNSAGGGTNGDFEVQAFLVTEGTPSATLLSQLAAWKADFYPPGAVL